MIKKAICWVLALVLVVSIYIPSAAYAFDQLKNTDPDKYYILLDLKNQFVTVYGKDDAGKYTKIIRRFICTTGRTKLDPLDPEDEGTPTPKGIYKIGGRERFGKFTNFGGTYARYWTQIVGGVFFHSIMFSRRNIKTLQSSAYRNLGNNVSHGCVRLYVEDAKWLYYYACPGTTVNVSVSEPSNRKITRALKYKIPFGTYDKFQQNIYDIKEEANPNGTVLVNNAQIRSGNGNKDHAVARLKKGVKVEVLQTGDPWSKVKYKGREGYIITSNISIDGSTNKSGDNANVLKYTVYMYTNADADSKIICKIAQYTSLHVLETANGWAKVQYCTSTGYVKTSSYKKGWGIEYN